MIPLVGGSYNGRSPSFDAQRTVNLYPEVTESKTSRTPAVLIGTPGLEIWETLAGGGCLSSIVFDDNTAVFHVGTNVWKLDAAGTATLLGTTIATSKTVTSMAYNGFIIMLVMPEAGYFIDPVAGTVTWISDPDFLGGDTVDYIDGYFVWNHTGTGQFQCTQLYGTDIDPLDFATAEGSPDGLMSLIVDHREIWLMGRSSVEVWVNVGGADFPFQRIQGAFLEVGCAAAHSVAKMDNSVFWLASDVRGFGTLQRAAGYSPQRVSNHAFEYAVNNYSRIDDAVAYTYTQEGHSFYVLSFPTANATWVLDASTGEMHERAWRNPSTGLLNRHRSNCQINFAGETLVGDWENGNVYRLGLDVYTDNGDILPAIRVFPHIAGDGKLQFHHALQVFMQTGVGLVSGQGSDPQAMLKWSDDGGYTWSSEHWTTIGAIGATRTRARWRRLGRTRDRVYYLSITDPVKRVILGADLEVTGGRS